MQEDYQVIPGHGSHVRTLQSPASVGKESRANRRIARGNIATRAGAGQNLIWSNVVRVVCCATPGELASSQATACSAYRLSDDAPSTGTTTFSPRKAELAAV